MRRTGRTLRISGVQHARLMAHLFPGDGLEAAAILLCSRFGVGRTFHVTRDVVLVPHGACATRTPDRLVWPGEWLEQAIDAAERYGDSLFLLHSHPGGYFDFSDLDDASDRQVMPGLFEAIETDHGSAVMTPDGAVRARVYTRREVADVELVSIAGDDVRFCWAEGPKARPLAFTGEMTAELNRLSAFIVGVSGTGSIAAEQAYRLGFGEVGLVDPDHVEPKNLNRILNSTTADAGRRRLKVEMFAEAAKQFAPDALTRAFPWTVLDRDVVLAAAEADVIFSCVDSHEGRQICDLVAAAFGVPLIDMGVQIPVGRASGGGQRIAGVFGRIDYVQPGGASLEDREVYSAQSVAEEYIARAAPAQYAGEVRDGYMKGRIEEAPSVLSLNMRTASAAVMEFVARAYPFRQEPNRNFARTIFDLAAGEEERLCEDEFVARDNPLRGSGARAPLLGLPVLNERAR